MPPPESPRSSHEGQSSTGTEAPYYSNEDVAILHDIVVLAQELLPTLPERERLPTNALFSAYYDILPRLGINADHDSRYARVLFKIGGLRGHSGGLYSRFEDVLEGMGIEIEFGDHDYEDGEDDSQFVNSKDEYDAHEDATDGTTPPKDETLASQTLNSKAHRRYNSESSMWDTRNETKTNTKGRRSSFSTGVKNDTQDTRPAFLQEIERLRPPAPNPEEAARIPQKEDPQHHVGTWVGGQQQRPPRRRGSNPTLPNFRIRRMSATPSHRERMLTGTISVALSEDFILPGDYTAVTSDEEDEDGDPSSPKVPFHPERRSSGRMQIKVDLMLQKYLESLVKSQIRKWRNKALVARDRRLQMEDAGMRCNQRQLKRGALGHWKHAFDGMLAIKEERCKRRESEDIFRKLEFRAGKARDYFLMLKALDKWRDLAREQANRTYIAREHMDKYRLFHAWKAATAVDDLKADRFAVQKFFTAVKNRKDAISNAEASVIKEYEHNLVERFYWQWVHKLQEQRAQKWWSQRAKSRALFHWVAAYHNTWNEDQLSEEDRRKQLVRKTWRKWKNLTDRRHRQEEDAAYFFRAKICCNTLRKWRRETQIVPAQQMVQADVRYRIIRDAFDTWRLRARQERQAAAADRNNILQEAMTTWRHKLRLKTFERAVSTRIARQQLEKLQLEATCARVRREKKTALLSKLFGGWKGKARTVQSHGWQQEDVAHGYASQKLKNTALKLWYKQMALQKEREAAALSFSQPLLLQKTLTQWTRQKAHVQQLDKWAGDADYYFRALRSLKRWKVEAEASKREKRKQAFAQVRRTVKMNLVRRVFLDWKQKGRQVLELREQAQNVQNNKIVVQGMEIFDKWRAKSADVTEMEALARGQVLTKNFTKWRERSSDYQALEKEGVLTHEERRKNRAFKKWSLITLRLRNQENWALDIREKNAKKSVRKMFNYWHLKAEEKRPQKPILPDDPGDPRGIIERAGAWSDFGDGEEDELAQGADVVIATPIPGYMATPSMKRSQRISAVAARFSSTTPKAPLSTPFERQLRAQYSGGQLHPYRSSRLGKSGFEDIQERSYNE